MLAIVIITYNIPPEVFLLQIEAVQKFCKDPAYTVIVVDNSSSEEAAENIRYHSERLLLKYIRTKASSENSSDSHAWAARFVYERYQFSYTHYLFLDHDCIPVREFNVEEMLRDKVIGGIGQEKKKTYFWPGCLMFDQQKIGYIDFSPNSTYGLDTGGNTYKVIEEFGEENCLFFNEVPHQNPHYRGRYDFYNMINDDMFIHFVSGSNWHGGNEHEHTDRLNSLVNITRGMINA